MDLPDFAPVTTEALAAVAAKYGAARATPMPEVGIFNRLYALGDRLVLRVPRDHPAFTGAALKEARVVPAVVAAGVRTPALVDFDGSCSLLPVPYGVYERVGGVNAEQRGGGRSAGPDAVWRSVGHDLARLHLNVAADGPLAGIDKEALPPPQALLNALADEGYLTPLDAGWLEALLGRLEGAVQGATGRRFSHGDVQLTNVMVGARGEYLGLLDWGASGWGDPAEDFAGVPLRVVPALLSSYREVAPLDDDEHAEARILYRHLQIALFLVRRPPLPGRSWAERPLGAAFETLYGLITDPRWRRFVR